jgi:hypothetical protein
MASVSPRDSEPQADAVAVVTVAEPLERQEDPVVVLGWDAGAAVDDADLHHVVVPAGGDQHLVAGRAVADGVGHEVDEHALQQRRVGDDVGQFDGDVILDPILQGAEVVDRPGHDLLQSDGLERQSQHTCLQAAHVEQVLHQAVQFGQGLVGGGEQFVAVLLRPGDVLAAQTLDGGLAADSGVRRS